MSYREGLQETYQNIHCGSFGIAREFFSVAKQSRLSFYILYLLYPLTPFAKSFDLRTANTIVCTVKNEESNYSMIQSMCPYWDKKGEIAVFGKKQLS